MIWPELYIPAFPHLMHRHESLRDRLSFAKNIIIVMTVAALGKAQIS
jgi:hypothetical protein